MHAEKYPVCCSPSMEDLPDDLLVKIADTLVVADLRKLRLVAKRCHAAVGQCAIQLSPHHKLTGDQLAELGRRFPNAAGLRLTSIMSDRMSDESLMGLSTLFPRLRRLEISWCGWLTSKGVAYVGQMSHLESLTLAFRYGVSELPPAINQLRSLQHLNLQGCQKSHLLPDELTGLVSLLSLNLSYCRDLRALPAILNLPLLQDFNLRSCTLRTLPEGISGLTSLRMLNLSFNDSLKLLSEAIGALSLLQHLDLSQCTALAQLPYSIGGLTSLETLDLQGCCLLRSLPESIGVLFSLTKLQLWGCKTLRKLPESVQGLSALEELGLAYCESLAALPAGVAGLPALRLLDLHGCSALAALPASFTPQTGRRIELRLDGCPAQASWLAMVPFWVRVSVSVGLQWMTI